MPPPTHTHTHTHTQTNTHAKDKARERGGDVEIDPSTLGRKRITPHEPLLPGRSIHQTEVIDSKNNFFVSADENELTEASCLFPSTYF